jgi:hypothetical protein
MRSEFLTKLNSTKIGTYQGRGVWQLNAPLVYASEILGEVVSVPAKFVTDFASVPRIPGIWWIAGGLADEAAVIHDWIYNQSLFPRDVADKVFLEAMVVMGLEAWRRYLIYAAVRAFGWRNYGKGKVIVDVGSD